MPGRLEQRRGLRFGVAACFFILAISNAQGQESTYPNILGTYDGTFSGSDFSCSDPLENGPFTGIVNFTIDDQQGSSFAGSGTLSQGGETDPLSIGGVIATNGHVSGEFTVQDPVDPGRATFSGTLSGDVLRFNFNGSDSGCSFSGSMSATRASTSGGIDPEEAPGNVVTTQSQVDSFARGQPVANSNRIRSILSGGGNNVQASKNSLTLSGMAAGEGDAMPYGIWFGYSYNDAKNDFSTTAFKSSRHSVLFGLDTMPGDDWLVGVSVGLERSDVTTHFNGGEQDISAITVAPYIGVLLSEWLTLDATAGIGDVRNSQYRTQGATRIDSNVDSTRLFANINLAATYSADALHLTGLAGMLWATQRDDDFLESNGQFVQDTKINVGRFLLGGEVAYSAGNWEPYASGLFEYDFNRTTLPYANGVAAPENDDTDVVVSVGLRYFGDDNITGSIEYNTVLGRQNLNDDTFNASVRWQF